MERFLADLIAEAITAALPAGSDVVVYVLPDDENGGWKVLAEAEPRD